MSDAAAFVEENGDALDGARLRALLRGESPPPEVVAELEAAQRSDGGFPSTWVPRTSSLDATCFRLAQLDDLPHESVRPIVERALGFLAARQREDGSWDEDETAGRAAGLYVTANCASWLGGDEGRRAAAGERARARRVWRPTRGPGSRRSSAATAPGRGTSRRR